MVFFFSVFFSTKFLTLLSHQDSLFLEFFIDPLCVSNPHHFFFFWFLVMTNLTTSSLKKHNNNIFISQAKFVVSVLAPMDECLYLLDFYFHAAMEVSPWISVVEELGVDCEGRERKGY